MGLGTRFDPRGVATPVGVLGDLLDELASALAKTAKGGEGDRFEVVVLQLLLLKIAPFGQLFRAFCAKRFRSIAKVGPLTIVLYSTGTWVQYRPCVYTVLFAPM